MTRLQAFFGDDWDDALDSIKSTPAALGNVAVGAFRQVRPIDVAALALVVAGWGWLVFGYGLSGDHRLGLTLLALLPMLLWLGAGAVGGLIFEIGGIGPKVMSYWEAYVLILLFSLFGTVSLRAALNPRDRRVYRPATTPDA